MQPTNEQAPVQQYPPTQPTYTPEQVEQIRRTNKKKLMWGIICLVGPIGLLVVTILGYAIINFISGAAAPDSTGGFGEVSPAKTIGNVVLFLTGAVSVLTMLPGIIGGIILIATRKKI